MATSEREGVVRHINARSTREGPWEGAPTGRAAHGKLSDLGAFKRRRTAQPVGKASSIGGRRVSEEAYSWTKR